MGGEGKRKEGPSPRGCGPQGRVGGGRLLPWPSLKTSLSSWELEGHRAEIHRCFSLLGRGRLSCHNAQSAVSQGQSGETGLGELGMMSRLRTHPRASPHSPVCPQAGAPPHSEHKNRAGPESVGCQLRPRPVLCHRLAARLARPCAYPGVLPHQHPSTLTLSGPSAGTGASRAARGGAEAGTRGQGCLGASGLDP